MPDLETQIRSYFDTTTIPVEVDDLLSDRTLLVPPVTVPRPTRRRGLLIAAAAAGIVIVAFALNLLTPGTEPPPVIQPPPTTIPIDQRPVSDLFDLTDWIAVYENPPNNGSSMDSGTFLIHPDGTGRHEGGDIDARILNGVGMMPDWSPDGTKIAMARRPIGIRSTVGPDHLYEVDLTNGTTRDLSTCEGTCISDWYPAYSPDGKSIAFIRLTGRIVTTTDDSGGGSGVLEDYSCGIWIGSVDSLQSEQVVDDPGCVTSSPRWSPSGDRLVYSQNESTDTSPQAIFVIDLSTRQISQITEFELDGGEPDWSPDGEWVLFGTHPTQWWDAGDGPGGDLYRVMPGGTALQQLTSFDSARGASRPRYTPDGEWIVFTVDNEIWVMRSDGGETISLITGGRYAQTDWQP